MDEVFTIENPERFQGPGIVDFVLEISIVSDIDWTHTFVSSQSDGTVSRYSCKDIVNPYL
jgi:hypothetical protein